MEFDNDAVFVMIRQAEISEKNHFINKQMFQLQEEIQWGWIVSVYSHSDFFKYIIVLQNH